MVDTAAKDEMSFLLSVTGKLAHICGQSLQQINLQESDKGVAGLILQYAKVIDEGRLAELAKFGPLLLQAMESLQMTPKARAQASKGNITNDKPVKSPLDELRNRRNARQNGTSNLDSATS